MWGEIISPHPLFPQIIPAELRNKWQQYAEDLDSPLGGTSDRHISSIVITLEVPDAIVVVSTAGQSVLQCTSDNSDNHVCLTCAPNMYLLPQVQLKRSSRLGLQFRRVLKEVSRRPTVRSVYTIYQSQWTLYVL